MENEQSARHQNAIRKMKRLKGFYTHLFIYISVNIFLIIANLIKSPSDLWVTKSIFGWGIGILVHLLYVVFFYYFNTQNWEERKIKQYMDKD
ncbi:2TM domain-containing protein [Bacillus wiedmannii]|uniref:2TM domain-containing protein n=1 Tax=Bacillus cereus group TaxID=86661 RepID=UPI000BF55408|nr:MULTISPECIES: 2TM domain-containing protein [Bacillus cereus group]MED2795817.1 2TM domain-containing protein [Bacillus wiedmannii]PFB67457.1 histidine kinase [Bacillus cereus]